VHLVYIFELEEVQNLPARSADQRGLQRREKQASDNVKIEFPCFREEKT